MASQLLPRGALMSLPTETLCHIITYVDEADVFALSVVNRRLNTVAAPALWEGLYNDSLRSKEVLLWAVEEGRHEVLQQLLEHGVSPNFLYLSSILRSRLLDVFATQGRRGTAGPREDRTLRREIFREKYCRSTQMRRRVDCVNKGLRNNVPIDQDFEYYSEKNLDYTRPDVKDMFSVTENPETLKTSHYWAWSPSHVAIQLGDNTALQLLLEHDADANAQCSGLCDCAAPVLTGRVDPIECVTPHKDRSVFSALHVAICSGNEEAVRSLISHGASTSVGSLVTQPNPLHRKARLAISAFQQAAWLGSTRMCCILLENSRVRKDLDKMNQKKQTALSYAAASGTIRTVGKLLLENGAKMPYYADSTNPILGDFPQPFNDDTVRQLCMQYRYGEARWLLHFCRRLYISKPVSTVQLLSRTLAVLCVLRKQALYNRLSLREQQDRLYLLNLGSKNLDVQQEMDAYRRETEASTKEMEASRDSRVAFAKELLDLGADPNRPQQTDIQTGGVPISSPRRIMLHRTSVQLAANFGFTEMIHLLLSHGANCNEIGGHDKLDLRETPLLLAAKNALGRGESGDSAFRAILDAGASLDDREDQSILRTFKNFGYHRSRSDTARQDWDRIAEMLLSRGAADKVTDWEGVVEHACTPGYLRYCEMLESSRPIQGLDWERLARMLRRVATGRSPMGTVQETTGIQNGIADAEMVSWVLSLCGRNLTNKEVREKFRGSVRRLRKDLSEGSKAGPILDKFLRSKKLTSKGALA